MADDAGQTDRRYRPEARVMQGVIPYLVLSGKTGAAIDFYIRAFAAKDIGRMDLDGSPGRYMHAQVEINGGALMLTDFTGPEGGGAEVPALAQGHLQLVVPDGQAWWDRAVAAGCMVRVPFERQPWGDDWGLLEDPFGIRWAMLTPGPQTWAERQ